MASPRAIVSIGRLAPRSPQYLRNISPLSSPKSPVGNYLSTNSRKTGQHAKSCKLSSVNIDTPNRMKILHHGLSNCSQNILGSGGFGTVIRASYKGNEVAAKIIRHRKDSDASVNAEKHAASFRHDNIIRVLGTEKGPALSMITMELCGKSLQEMIDERPLDCRERLNILMAVTRATQFCHRAGVVHADIKPKNVLISPDGKPKLSDFGSSVLLGQVDTHSTIRGTPGYAAPEVIRGESPTTSADVHSLGVSAWQMLSRQSPFGNLHAHTILYLTGKGMKPRDKELDDTLGGKYKMLYRRMWSFAKEDRPSIDTVITELESLEPGAPIVYPDTKIRMFKARKGDKCTRDNIII